MIELETNDEIGDEVGKSRRGNDKLWAKMRDRRNPHEKVPIALQMTCCGWYTF